MSTNTERIIKVVIGALFLVIALSWVDTLEVITTYTLFIDDKTEIHQRHMFQSRVFGSIFITLLSLTIIVVLWSFFECPIENENVGGRHDDLFKEVFE